jgi:putative SOS response-associated peptidase YedK
VARSGVQANDDLKGLLRPFEVGMMKRFPVSTRVNLVKNDDPECARELREQSVTA